jgi:Fic family protein
MSQFLEGVVTGIATSALVAVFVYWRQKLDSDKSNEILSNHIRDSTDVSKEGLRTSIEIRDIANEIHKIIRASQDRAARDPQRETLTAEHISMTEEFIQMSQNAGQLDISSLHAALMGDEIIYAGVFRDANLVVSGSPNDGSPLTPIRVEDVPDRMKSWLNSLSELVSRQSEGSRSVTPEEIIDLHVELMRIHPFFDGNGLVGRAIMAALSKRLLGQTYRIPRADPEYFAALRVALLGDSQPFLAYLESREV